MSRELHTYRRAYRHLWETYGQSWRVRTSFILQILTRTCKIIVIPIAISLIIANLSQKDYAGAERAVLLFAGASLLMGIAIPLLRYIGIDGENKSYRLILGNYFSRLVHADLAYFNTSMAGSLTTATRQYADSCMIFVRSWRDRYLNTILSIIFPLGVLLWIDVPLGLMTLGLSIIQTFYLLWAARVIAPYRTRARELYKQNSGHMADIVSNILAVKSSAQEAKRVAEVKAGSVAENKIYAIRYTLQSKLVALRECITVTFFLSLLWVTIQRMSHGSIDITSAIIVVTYTATIMGGIYTLSDDLDEHDDLIDKIIPAFEVLHRENDINDPEHPKKLKDVQGTIELRNVAFAYEKGQPPILKDFSLAIPAGQKVGIVGLSGAGKSTLTKLLLRFNDVQQGAVLLDGIDVRELAQTDLRHHIAYVPQEPLLFHASIEENVLLGSSDATLQEVTAALKAAHAWQFISQLPEGVHSIVGERGVKLSGGQKQRVAIARAVLRDAPIIILDEATSALDSESEQIIKDSFSDILQGKTAIVIAHRLSTLSEMDRIVVIDKGVCVEDGTHQSLLAKNGTYARLWKRQLKHLEDPL